MWEVGRRRERLESVGRDWEWYIENLKKLSEVFGEPGSGQVVNKEVYLFLLPQFLCPYEGLVFNCRKYFLEQIFL